MSCWPPHCDLGGCFSLLSAGAPQLRWSTTQAPPASMQPEAESTQWSWEFQTDQDADLDLGMNKSSGGQLELSVTTMSGAAVAALPLVAGEIAAALKRRIQQVEGTAPYMQKLVQGGKVLGEADVISSDPVVLVRVERKKCIVASVHTDLRLYDLETGDAMRSTSSLNLRLSCLLADWENARCFSGSADGVVRVWDTCTGRCLQTLLGHMDLVCSLCVEIGGGADGDRILAGALDGSIRIWPLELLAGTTMAGEFSQTPRLVAYDLTMTSRVTGSDAGCECLWTFCLEEGPVPVLEADWALQQCLLSPGGSFLELRNLQSTPAGELLVGKFGPSRPHPRGLVRVDWEGRRVLVVVEPFALELWSLSTFELLHRFRDASGDGTEIVSLDVDWSFAVPRAITCRHYVDWELVAGEVCIQHWNIEEGGGSMKQVSADHPVVGGFDIVAVVAQL
eukprot:CAMPEP_0180648502 /NCGR_PEP_ID=MMETSP1037_2-20121125/51008_1 /TAXON_ID=632150 /ORGANISM="Azadinium spinosum, Strain 3D9" /LENGTH=449 /DNA_ID=CAMNT_0022673333 /DNA_START=103 /DNA_END=1452 /DNA_ORIENTATION=+